MFAFSKKVAAVALSIALTSQSFSGVVSKQCAYTGETEFFPVGDERGSSILTKKEVHRDCNITVTTQGACSKWEDQTTEFTLHPSTYNTYKTNNNNGALGEMLSAVGAYDQIGHFWSGWHGYCERGMKYDFSWAKDPMFWASLAMGAVLETGGAEEVTNAAGNAWQQLGESVGLELSEDFGACLVAAGVDLAGSVYSYFKADDSAECDPVDEFCDEQNEANETDIMTIDQQQYDDMIADNPDYAKYIEVLDNQDGILTIRFKPLNDIEGMDKKSQEEMQKAKAEMKKIQFEISAAVLAGKMAACSLTGGTGIDYNSDTGTRFSVKQGIGVAINAIPAEWLAPYGALIKAGLKIALEFINSFNDIDTCMDEDDAKEAGSRHLKTFETLPYDLCVKTQETCAQEKFLGSGCGLNAFHYCCYDQMLTKILVAQIKAQLGRDWAHCTGITLRDLNYVSFRQCTAEDKKAGFDGTKVVLKYDEDDKLVSPAGWTDAKWLQSYQHKKKCIDLTEFKKYLEATFSQDIDFSDFDRIFQDTSEQIDPLP